MLAPLGLKETETTATLARVNIVLLFSSTNVDCNAMPFELPNIKLFSTCSLDGFKEFLKNSPEGEEALI